MRHHVAIIGYGPVGALLANLLAAHGVPTIVLEREAETYHLPRAVHFDDEVMRIFQSVGLAEAMETITHVSPGTKFVNASGNLLVDWPRAPGIGPLGWHRSFRFHQPDLENILRRATARHPCLTIRTRCEVLDITQTAGAATLTLIDRATGNRETLETRYVVGCDGARSLVRRLIGTSLEDLHAHQQWLVTDLILSRPKPELGDATIQHCNPARPATYVRGTGQRRRWEIMLMPGDLAPGDDPARLTDPAAVWRLLAPWISPHEATIERAAVYTFHAAIARDWRDRRLLLAGDACHMTPPFLGQGMCAGMRDAANLAWKLARVLAGKSPDSLLDSYGPERTDHVRDFIALAVEVGEMIQMTNTEAARARDASLAGNPRHMRSPDPRLGQHTHRPEPEGRIAPQPTLANGTRLDDAIGHSFAVIARPEFLDPIRTRIAATILDSPDPALATWLDALDTNAILLRPDRYILGTARDARGVVARLDAV